MIGNSGNSIEQRPAVFLDRDAVLMGDPESVSSIRDRLSFPPEADAALKSLSRDRELVFFGNSQHSQHSQQNRHSQHQENLRAAAQDPSLDLKRSFYIGDDPYDLQTAVEAGVFGLYLLTGTGLERLSEVPLETPVFHTLLDAAQWILAHPSPSSVFDDLLDRGAEAIRRGELVAFPTETVYGLGADALNPEAAAKIFAAKQRPLHDPLIVHVSSFEEAEQLASHVPDLARRLMEHFWPGPLTLVLPKADNVPDIVTAGGNTVAVRMPSHPLALELIRRSGTPVAAPSANLFGKTSPTTAGHVADQLAGRYAVLIDGGACRVGVESTVLSLAGDRPRVLRPGGITAEDIAEIAGPIASGPVKETTQTLGSPGLLPSHYAPATPMLLVDDASEYAERKDIAVILREPTEKVFAGNVFVLSSRNDLRGAAAMLYQTLRLVDRMNFCLIVAERFPQEGIGVAVNDRLTRAAAATPEKV